MLVRISRSCLANRPKLSATELNNYCIRKLCTSGNVMITMPVRSSDCLFVVSICRLVLRRPELPDLVILAGLVNFKMYQWRLVNCIFVERPSYLLGWSYRKGRFNICAKLNAFATHSVRPWFSRGLMPISGCICFYLIEHCALLLTASSLTILAWPRHCPQAPSMSS